MQDFETLHTLQYLNIKKILLLNILLYK